MIKNDLFIWRAEVNFIIMQALLIKALPREKIRLMVFPLDVILRRISNVLALWKVLL